MAFLEPSDWVAIFVLGAGALMGTLGKKVIRGIGIMAMVVAAGGLYLDHRQAATEQAHAGVTASPAPPTPAIPAAPITPQKPESQALPSSGTAAIAIDCGPNGSGTVSDNFFVVGGISGFDKGVAIRGKCAHRNKFQIHKMEGPK
jgi:hypothetical protein